MYFKLLTIVVLVATVRGQGKDVAQGGDLESIIQQIFGNPNATGTGSTDNLQNKDTGPITNAPQTAGNGQNTVDNTNKNTGPSTLVPGIATNAEDTTCTTDDGQPGECVTYYLCSSNNTIIDDGESLIDIRVNGPCPSYLQLCCLPKDRRAPDNPVTPAPPTVERQGCGWRNPDGVGFRIKGDVDSEAKFGEFPWMVAILKIEPVNDNDPDGQKLNVYVGGGSLIHPSVVLTAAHYVADHVNNVGVLRVRAGEWDTQTKNEIYPYQDRDVSKIDVHKDFNKGNLFYDIAVVFLTSPMEMAPNVGVACLPPPRERAQEGTRCFASGWGKDQFGKEGRYQVILKKVEVPVVERAKCQEALRRTRLGRFFMLHSSFMCAGGERDKDTCKGDGGSPLVCPIESEKDRYVQAGIVAWGIGCGSDGTPGVYVDVANLRAWIDDKVAGRGYDPNTYTY